MFRVLAGDSQVVFTSWDSDSLTTDRTEKNGIYRMICTMPGAWLKPGVYSVTLGASTNRRAIEMHDEVLRFEVSPYSYPFNEGRVGVVTPVLKWQAEQLNDF